MVHIRATERFFTFQFSAAQSFLRELSVSAFISVSLRTNASESGLKFLSCKNKSQHEPLNLVSDLHLVLVLRWDHTHLAWSHLEARQVGGLEVVGRAAAPVHDVLVLTFASQLAVPVGEPEVVVHHGPTEGAVLQDRVEERLQEDTKKI